MTLAEAKKLLNSWVEITYEDGEVSLHGNHKGYVRKLIEASALIAASEQREKVNSEKPKIAQLSEEEMKRIIDDGLDDIILLTASEKRKIFYLFKKYARTIRLP